MRPKDVPPMSAVRSYFAPWNRDRPCITINDTVRKRARQALNRARSRPSAFWTPHPSQRPKQAENAATMRGKKVNGRRRQCRVAPNGFLLRVLVHPAAISAPAGAAWRLAAHHQSFPRMRDIRGDEGYTPGFNEERRQNTTIRLHVIEKPPGQTGCAVIPKRWVGERSMAWAGRNRWERRIIIRRNNRTPESSNALLYPSSRAMPLHRLYPKCSFLITLSVDSRSLSKIRCGGYSD